MDETNANATSLTGGETVKLHLLGVILLGLGALTAGAAGSNSPSLTLNLGLIFGGLALLYGVAYFLNFVRSVHPIFSQGVLLAAAASFGYGLWGINQDFNLHLKLSTVVLLWSIAPIVMAITLESAALLVMGIVLFAGWAITGYWETHSASMWYPVLTAVVLVTTSYHRKSFLGLFFAVLGLSIWIGLAAAGRFEAAPIFLPLTLVLLGVALYALAGVYGEAGDYGSVSRVYVLVGLISGLGGLFFLSSRTFGVSMARNWLAFPGWPTSDGLSMLVVNVVLTLLALGLIVWGVRGKANGARPSIVETSALVALLSLTWIYTIFPEVIPEELAESILTDHFLFYPVLFNVILFALLLGLIYLGRMRGDRLLFNAGLWMFVIMTAARYYDGFVPGAPRYVFLFAGGIVLILSGVILERNPRHAEGGV